MKQDLLYEMLWGDLVREVEGVRDGKGNGAGEGKGEGDTTVREALEGLGEDAMWLALGRTGLREEKEKFEEIRIPVAVAGGVPWVQVA